MFAEEDDVDDFDVSEGSDSLGITDEEALNNYESVGTLVDSDSSSVKWNDFQYLFNEEVKVLLDEVLMTMKLQKLSEFQEIFLHSVGSKKDVFAVVRTGTGKTEATGVGALLMRKVFSEPKGLIVMFVPLTGIMSELVEHGQVKTAAITMSEHMYGKSEEGRIPVSEEDVLSGKYARLVMHPECLGVSSVEKLMLKLKQQQLVLGVFIDEFHAMQPRHWASFRPMMEDQTARLRVFLRKGAPTGALSATSTQAEVETAVQTLGLRGAPVILSESPMQSNTKFIKLKRPSDNYGFEGFTDKKENFHPGLLDQLKCILLDKYIQCIEQNIEPKHGIIFFRTENQLIKVLNYLRQTLSVSNVRDAPFVSLVGSTPEVTEMVIRKRAGSISLFLTTQKMLMGLNIPNIEICIFIKPMNMLHSLVQGAGRAGRPLLGQPGKRAKTLVYILANGGDVGAQVKGMSEEVRGFVNHKTGCLKAFMGEYFIGHWDNNQNKAGWCCSFCSSVI